jgi:hypothetical protein
MTLRIQNLEHDSSVLKSWESFLLMFLLVGISGIPFFTQDNLFIVISFIYSAILFYLHKEKIDRFFIVIIILLILLSFCQFLTSGSFELVQNISLILRFSIPYFTIKLLKKDFFQIYIKLLYFFCIISLLFFLPTYIPFLQKIIYGLIQKLSVEQYDWRGSIIIYTSHYELRNDGPFWEAGAFSIFLNLALSFNILNEKKIISKKNVVFIIGIITTFSTAGFIALFFIISFYFLINRTFYKNIIYLPLIILLFWFSFNNFDFLGEKINTQFDKQLNADNPYLNLGRFQSALLDIQDIQSYPIFGRGRGEFRFEKDEYFEDYGPARRSNGLTDFIVKMGIPFAIFYFVSMFLSFKSICAFYKVDNKISIIIFIAVLILSFSQLIYTYPFFISLIYFHFVLLNNNLKSYVR